MASTHDEQAANRIDDLITSHPALFAGREFQIAGRYLPAGWFSIVDRMCTDIESLLGDEAPRFKPVQAKEKWGSWRFYWRLEPAAGEDVDEARLEPFTADLTFTDPENDKNVAEQLSDEDIDVSDTATGVRMTVMPSGDLRRAIYTRVRQTEIQTERTCMWCGKSGSYWTNGWVHVACERHRRSKAITLDEWRRRVEERRSELERDTRRAAKDDDHE